MSKRTLAGFGLAFAVLAGCTAVPSPSTSPSVPASPSEATIVVTPQAVAALPKDPALYPNTGSADSDATTPNGSLPDGAAQALNRQIVSLNGLGGVLRYAGTVPPNAPLTPPQAVAVAIAEAEHPSGINWQGRCEGFAGSWVNGALSDGWYSARDAFYDLPGRHLLVGWNDAPAGSTVRWSAPPFGHAVESLGNGMAATTDFVTVGRVSIVPIKQIADQWFGGEHPSYWDPLSYPRGTGGSNGVKPPVTVTVQPAFPIAVGDMKVQVISLKARFHWGNRAARYGSPFAVRIRLWQRNHGFAPSGRITSSQYKLMISGK